MTSLLLGVRLALLGNRARLVVTAGALALAVAFLSAVLGALPAYHAKQERLAARQPSGGVGPTPALTDGIRAGQLNSYWRGHPLTVERVLGVGRAPVPPGVARLPRPGEVLASPALAAALRGPHAAELRSRVPGRVVAVIADRGLSGPRELFAYTAADPTLGTLMGAGAWGERRTSATPVSSELRYAGLLGAAALLLPVLVLAATATRLSAASRERRLAAVRLVGASPRQARALAAGEALVVGAAGVLLGGLLFLLVRIPAARLVPLADGVFARDVRPPMVQALAVLVGVPLLCTVTSLLSLRRVVTSPLGISRQARVSRAGWARLVPLGAGLLLLTAARWDSRAVTSGSALGGFLLVGGGVVTMAGLAVATPALSRLGGVLLGRLGGLGSHLASRRVAADPGASGRVVTGTVLVVFAAGWLYAFLPLVAASQGGGQAELQRALRPATLRISIGQPAPGTPPVRPAVDRVAALRRVHGVRGVATLQTLQLVRPGYRPPPDGTLPSQADQPTQVAVGSCAALSRVLRSPLRCTGAGSYLLRPGAGAGAAGGGGSGVLSAPAGGPWQVLGTDGEPLAGSRLTLAQGPELPVPGALSQAGLLYQGVLLDPALVPAGVLQGGGREVLVATDGRPATVERVRGALDAETSFGALTTEEQIQQASARTDGYARATALGTLLALLVGGASLAVTTADLVRERRRGLAALVALGTPLRVLRRSVLLQLAGPLLVNVAVALGAAVVASICYLGISDQRTSLPWGAWSLTGVAALLAVLLATAATLPLVRATGRPEALRSE